MVSRILIIPNHSFLFYSLRLSQIATTNNSHVDEYLSSSYFFQGTQLCILAKFPVLHAISYLALR